MSKNNKEKSSSFWKKLGLKKNKGSISSLKSEPNLFLKDNNKNDTASVNSKRLSGKIPPPPQQQPPTPRPTYQQTNIISKPVINGDISVNPANTMKTNTTIATEAIKTAEAIKTTDSTTNYSFSKNSKITDTLPVSGLKSEEQNEEKDISTIVISTEQPNVTPTQNNKQDSISSKEEELLSIISNLKSELETKQATIKVMQGQKEAVSKDLDYFELTVDELLAEKNDLIQQLEDEKIKSQHHLDDLNLLLEKMKSSADSARDQSFVIDKKKQEYENFQIKAQEEKEALLVEMKQKDKTIRELKSKLNKSQEQTETLKDTIDHLVKAHAEEMNRVTMKLNEEIEKNNSWSLHTPNGSPRIKPEENQEEYMDKSIPVPSKNSELNNDNAGSVYGTPQSTMDSNEKYRTPKSSIDYIDENDLDDQLMKLTKEKEKLQSYYSKIPITGGGPQSRRRKEELEAMLDQVDSQLSKVKQKIRRN